MKNTKKVISVDTEIKVVPQLPFNHDPEAPDRELIARARAAYRSIADRDEDALNACLDLTRAKARAQVTNADRRVIEVETKLIVPASPENGIYVPRVRVELLKGSRESKVTEFARRHLGQPGLIPTFDDAA